MSAGLAESADAGVEAFLKARRYPEAFELLLSLYQNKVVRLAFSILGNEALADENAQESFIRIWRGMPAFRSESSVSTWIYTIVRNQCLTALKRLDPARTVSLDSPGVRSRAEQQGAAPSVPEISTDLEKLLSRLPPNYRQVLTLFYMEEKSYEEVARMLDLPLGTVKTWLYRAKKELAEAMVEAKMKEGVR